MAKFHNNKLKTVSLDDKEDKEYVASNKTAKKKKAVPKPTPKVPVKSSPKVSPSGTYGSYLNQTSGIEGLIMQGNTSGRSIDNGDNYHAPGASLQPIDDYTMFNLDATAPFISYEPLNNEYVPQLGSNNHNLQDSFDSSFWTEPSTNHAIQNLVDYIPNGSYDMSSSHKIGFHHLDNSAIAGGDFSNNYSASTQFSFDDVNKPDLQGPLRNVLNGETQTTDFTEDRDNDSEIKLEACDDSGMEADPLSGSEYDENEIDGEPTVKVPKVNKDGAPRKPRQPRPKLLKWSDNDWKNVALGIVWACGENDMQIPFAQAAQVVGNSCTAGALQQALLKLRGKQIAGGNQIPSLKMAWTRKGGKTAAPASVATPKNTQTSSLGKITILRRKSTRQEGHQTFLVTLKRAYNEESRIDLDFPHIVKKASRKEQRARTRKSANSRSNRSADETGSANIIDPAPNVQYDSPNFKPVTNTDIIETHQLGKSDSLHFQPTGTQIGVVYKLDKIETVDGTASGKTTGDFIDASLFTPLTSRPTSPRKVLHLDVKSSQGVELEKMTSCLNPENAYIGTNFDQFQEVYKSVGSLENFGNHEKSMQSSPLTTDFSYTTSTGINTPANGTFSSAYDTPFTTTLANNLALVSQLEMSQLDNSVLDSPGLCDFDFSYPVQGLDDLSYNDVCMIRGDENKEENDEAPVLPYAEDDLYDIFINP